MNVTITIPDEFIAPLSAALGTDLSRAALEQLALEGYRTGKLSQFQVQQLLGFSNRWDTQKWLGERGANMSYGLDDLKADRVTLDRVLGTHQP
jgi:hypothetical protein